VFVENLNIFGFKSFNTKVGLKFDKGISGIIGPNGCGKSNIVDALRWVLGEQSTKQLRGAKMEDVIFNGSRNHKPMSLAQVELTLNNERGALPIDYDHVTVGRRLYRSGISEYTINKNVVRLKDVRELFLDTGMGSHAYSVIERQMVDNILSDTTGHRRFLFEEAAGIMKYKTRKKEALNKLDATQRDLLRVNDIITEVDRQVTSLKRQVGKARRYREIMNEIRELDLGLSLGRRSGWLEEIAGLDHEFGATQRAAEEAETRVAGLDARLEELHLLVLEHEKGVAGARELLAQVDDELGQVNSRILVYRERLESTGQKIVEAQQNTVRLADRMERNHADEAERRETIAVLEERETGERERLEAREKELAGVEGRVSELREAAERSQAVTREHLEERVRAEGAVESVRRRIEEIERRVGDAARRSETVDREEKDLRATAESAREGLNAARTRVEEIDERRGLLEIELQNHAARSDMFRKELGEKRENEAAARSRLETLEDLRSRYEGFAPGVRALMLGDDAPGSVLGTLSDLLQVPGEWVRALEPALSSAWQYVVTEDTPAATALIEVVRGDAAGYVTFLPLDRVPAPGPRPPGVRLASDVVSVDPRFENLVRHLLGNLALVDTTGEALALVEKGTVLRAATRDGVYVDGVVIAGGAGGPQGSELLEREDAIERARTEIDRLASELGDVAARGETLRKEGARLQAELHAAHAAAAEARDALAGRERDHAGLVSKLAHCDESRREVEETLAGLHEETDRLVSEAERLTEELHIRHRVSEDADRAHRETAGGLAEAERARESVLASVHEMRLRWARLEGEMKDARAALDRLLRERQELQDESARTRRDEEDAQSRKSEIQDELEAMAERVQDLHELRDQRATVVDARQREKSDVVAREQQDTVAVREVRRKAGEARQAAHGAELRLTQLRNDLTHLEDRLTGEYDMTRADLDAYRPGELPGDASVQLEFLRDRLRRLGPVNLLAVEEFEEKSERLQFMTSQRDDLNQARDTLHRTIAEINKKASIMFLDTFALVQENFQKTFQVLFQGGECSLTLTGDDPLEADIEVTARPRGKRPQGIQQLSSGERALTAIALLFAIYLVKPSPFCILDEVDAPLDDANIDRFVAMIKKFSERTQFIMITHNKKTMEAADCLYGVTMQQPGVSSVVSVRLDGAGHEMSEAARQVAEAVLVTTPSNGNGRLGGGAGPDDEDDAYSPESAIIQ
jgi:chromosome segregation protein